MQELYDLSLIEIHLTFPKKKVKTVWPHYCLCMYILEFPFQAANKHDVSRIFFLFSTMFGIKIAERDTFQQF